MNERARLLFVIENSVYGGGEKTFSQLIRGLPKEKFDLYCASLPYGRFHDEVKDHCRFLPLDLTRRFNLPNIGRLKGLMLEHKIDIAHSQGARADFYCGFAAAGAGVKALATVAMPVEGFNVSLLRKMAYDLLYSAAARRFSLAVTVSESLGARLRKKFRSVEVIPNGVDVDEFSPDNFNAIPVIEKFGLRGRLVIGALGRLEWQKGYSYLLSALDIVLRKDPELREKLICLVAGSGSLESRLKKQAAELGLGGNVIFCGEFQQARDFLGALDIFAMPSLNEGQPLALLEAMAMAKPIAASDIPGICGTVSHGHEALLVPPADAERLAAALLKLAQDLPAAIELGRGARKKAEGFGLPEFIGRHAALYSGLCAEAKG